MKIKPLVVSLVALGFISGAVFAADKAPVKAKKKAPKTMAVVAAPVVVAPVAKDTAAQKAVVEQNAFNNTTSTFNWADRVFVGGYANANLTWSSRQPIGSFADAGQVVDLYLPNANLFFDAKVNEWTTAHLNLVYLGGPTFSGSYKYPGSTNVKIDDGYVTISNFSRTPFYARVGVQYLPFGDYQRYPLIFTMAQAMEQISQPALTIGAITNSGFYAQVFAFNGPTKQLEESKYTMRNFGAKVGYNGTMDSLNIKDTKYNVDVSWIRNIYDADYLYAYLVNTPTASGYSTTGGTDDTNRVGAVSAHADLTSGQFDFNANFVTALNNLVQANSYYAQYWGYPTNTSRLWGADVGAGYSFKTMDQDSRVGIGYQWSGNGQFITDLYDPQYASLPHYTITADYKVNLMKNMDIALALQHSGSYTYNTNWDNNFSGTRGSNMAVTRLSVKF